MLALVCIQSDQNKVLHRYVCINQYDFVQPFLFYLLFQLLCRTKIYAQKMTTICQLPIRLKSVVYGFLASALTGCREIRKKSCSNGPLTVARSIGSVYYSSLDKKKVRSVIYEAEFYQIISIFVLTTSQFYQNRISS